MYSSLGGVASANFDVNVFGYTEFTVLSSVELWVDPAGIRFQ